MGLTARRDRANHATLPPMYICDACEQGNEFIGQCRKVECWFRHVRFCPPSNRFSAKLQPADFLVDQADIIGCSAASMARRYNRTKLKCVCGIPSYDPSRCPPRRFFARARPKWNINNDKPCWRGCGVWQTAIHLTAYPNETGKQPRPCGSRIPLPARNQTAEEATFSYPCSPTLLVVAGL